MKKIIISTLIILILVVDIYAFTISDKVTYRELFSYGITGGGDDYVDFLKFILFNSKYKFGVGTMLVSGNLVLSRGRTAASYTPFPISIYYAPYYKTLKYRENKMHKMGLYAYMHFSDWGVLDARYADLSEYNIIPKEYEKCMASSQMIRIGAGYQFQPYKQYDMMLLSFELAYLRILVRSFEYQGVNVNEFITERIPIYIKLMVTF